MWGEMASGLHSGETYLLAMKAMGALALVIIFERVIVLQFIYNMNFKKFLQNLSTMFQAGDVERAKALCKSLPSTSVPAIATKALETWERDPDRVRGVIEEETIDFLPRLERGINYLPALATLILLLGILATIDGIWGAFQSIDVLDTAKKQISIAKGISSSLYTTGLGLMFGMVILAAHQLVKSVAVRTTERIHYGLTVLMNLLASPMPMAFATGAPSQPSASTPAPSQSAASSDPISAASGEDSLDSQATTEEAGAIENDDTFDDASVEDIKDEEEII